MVLPQQSSSRENCMHPTSGNGWQSSGQNKEIDGGDHALGKTLTILKIDRRPSKSKS